MDSISTEAIFYSSRYSTSGGWKITLALPDDLAAKALDEIGAGQRYMLALAPIDDNEEPLPIVKKITTKAQMAGILCNDERFWGFLRKVYELECNSADEASQHVREWCKVSSRREFDTDHGRAAMWEVLRTEFDLFTGRISGPR